MKTKIFIIILITIALLFALGSAGGYEAGTLSLGAFLAHSAGSAAVIWASFSVLTKIDGGRH